MNDSETLAKVRAAVARYTDEINKLRDEDGDLLEDSADNPSDAIDAAEAREDAERELAHEIEGIFEAEAKPEWPDGKRTKHERETERGERIVFAMAQLNGTVPEGMSYAEWEKYGRPDDADLSTTAQDGMCAVLHWVAMYDTTEPEWRDTRATGEAVIDRLTMHFSREMDLHDEGELEDVA